MKPISLPGGWEPVRFCRRWAVLTASPAPAPVTGELVRKKHGIKIKEGEERGGTKYLYTNALLLTERIWDGYSPIMKLCIHMLTLSNCSSIERDSATSPSHRTTLHSTSPHPQTATSPRRIRSTAIAIAFGLLVTVNFSILPPLPLSSLRQQS